MPSNDTTAPGNPSKRPQVGIRANSAKRQRTVVSLYGRKYDFTPPSSDIQRTLMLATIPRSGSTYTAIRLWQTGLLGAPMEYLNFPILTHLFNRLGYSIERDEKITESVAEKYWSKIKTLRTSCNGTFGYKMFMANYKSLAKSYPKLLSDIAPNYVIYLTRNDVLAQAMSYSRAIRSKVWFEQDKKPEVFYDASHIIGCIRAIREQRTFWENIFNLTGALPIRIAYEDVMCDPDKVFLRIFDKLGIDFDIRAKISVPLIEKQSDHFNAIWCRRFTKEYPDLVASL